MVSLYQSNAVNGGTRERLPRPRRRGGQSLVELSVVLPILLLTMLATIDFGRLFFDYVQLRNAAREGAAYGARFPTDQTGISSRVTSHGVPGGTVVTTACNPAPTNCSGLSTGSTSTITVTASHTFEPITTAFLDDYGLGAIDLDLTASMRVLT